ncbi:MAG: helix-turn-helix domain-containing protein, partial [Pseudomonadota bacterium]
GETASNAGQALDDYSNEYATFGDRLAAARDAIGIGQGQLAKRLGVKRVTIENWEEDRAEPRANRLQMLAGILNVSLVWLMTGEGEGVVVAAEGEIDDTAEDILREISLIRAEHRRLAERSGRLEKRLRAYLTP